MGAEAEQALIRTARLVLEPLRADHAEALAAALADPALWAFTGTPEDAVTFARRAGGPPEHRNWVITDPEVVGYVQATVGVQETALAWVVGTAWQGRGYATEAAAAVRALFDRVRAEIHPDHLASQAVATRIGLRRSAERVDGEDVWR